MIELKIRNEQLGMWKLIFSKNELSQISTIFVTK